MLARVCELAFEVAKEGGAPSAMKNYLYLAQRPPRAYSVAQRALDEDHAFRQRVAAKATIDGVGEAGYLWLQRPEGWQDRFAALRSGTVVDAAASSSPSVPVDDRPPMPTPPDFDTPATAAPAEPAPTVSSIEDELSSLRSLVDRLADERQNVRSSVSELEEELETRRAENLEMSTRLSVLRKELVSVQTTEADVASQRDRALERVAELETEVETLRADVDRLSAEAEGSVAEHEAALTSLAEVGSQRDALESELAETKTELDTAKTALAEVEAARDAAAAELAGARSSIEQLGADLDTERTSRATEKQELDAERSGLLSEVTTLKEATGGLASERDALASELRTVTEDKAKLEASLDEAKQAVDDATERLSEMAQLREDNAELARRLAVAEQARVDLEGQLSEVSDKWQAASRQLTVFENVNSQLDTVVAERDDIGSQLDRANRALAGLRDRIGASHDRIRGELTGIESTFGDVPAEVDGDDSIAAIAEVADVPTTDAPAMSDDAVASDVAGIETAPFTDDGDDFDGAGLELDRDLLGGQSIGDMFGTDPASDEVDGSVLDETVADEAAADEIADAPDAFDSVDTDVADIADDIVAENGALAENGGIADAIDADVVDGAPVIDAEPFAGGADIVDAPDVGIDPMADAAEVVDADPFADTSEIAEVTDVAVEMPAADDIADAADEITAVADFADADADTASDEIADAEPIAGMAAAASTARSRIALDGDLDETEAARTVVHSPDVILLIDGDGASTLGWPHLDVVTRRGALVTYLGQLTAETGAAADVVFERPVGGEDALPVSEKVRVRIADDSVEESPIFSSIIDRYPLEWPIALVTDHETIADRGDDLGVTVMSNNQLLDLFLDLNSAS